MGRPPRALTFLARSATALRLTSVIPTEHLRGLVLPKDSTYGCLGDARAGRGPLALVG